MSRYVMGISALYHDAAAALLRDGEVVAASSEERFSRIKHDASIPVRAAKWCLQSEGISIEDVERVVYYEKPLRKFERLIVSQLRGFPRSLKAFHRMANTWLTQKLWVKNSLVDQLGIAPDKLLFSEHHLSHAASAFYSSPYEEAAVMTVDGVGEWATATLYRGGPDGLHGLGELQFPHSIGLVYSAFTAFLGFEVNDGEYKVMGMAGFGEPRYEDAVRKTIWTTADGGVEVDLRYFSYHHSATDSFSRRFVELFGEPRQPRAPFDPSSADGRRYADIAASIQKVTEDCLVELANALHRRTGLSDLCLAGGVALNCVANREILRRTPFRSLYVQPAAGDAGGAMGAAQWAWHEVLGQKQRSPLRGPDLGPGWSHSEICTWLRDLKVRFEELDEEELAERAVSDLVAGDVVGWFQGRAEWGPRALGHRSILADPRKEDMKLRINECVKFREPFRPFAPSVLAGAEQRCFELPPGAEAPSRWMTVVGTVHEDARSQLAATTHVDGTARTHVVDPATNPPFAELLRTMGQATGHPVVLNTSFNLNREPIVSTPIHALATFARSNMDCLYLGRCRVMQRRRMNHD